MNRKKEGKNIEENYKKYKRKSKRDVQGGLKGG